MASYTHRFFPGYKSKEILVFIKGNKHLNAYVIFDTEHKDPDPVIKQNDLEINQSEFRALNGALKQVLKGNIANKPTIKIYTNNLENIRKVIDGTKNTNSLTPFLDEYKDLSSRMDVRVLFVRKSEEKKTASDIDGKEEEFAREELMKLDDVLKKSKGELKRP